MNELLSEVKKDIKILILIFTLAFLFITVFSANTDMIVRATFSKGGFASGHATFICQQGENGARECNDYIKPSAARWNGITSRVSITEDTYQDPQYKIARANIHVYSRKEKADPTILGETFSEMGCTPLAGCRGADIDNGAVMTRATIYIYKQNIADIVKRFPGVNLNNCLNKTTTHEFGHALSLDHPPRKDGNRVVQSVMYTGASERTVIETYDKLELKKKWG